MPRTKTPTKKVRSATKPVRQNQVSVKAETPQIKQNFLQKTKRRYTEYLKRRPHRSFQRTRRRDYVRSLEMPGYFAFSAYVIRTLLSQKRLFGLMMLFYVVAGIVLVGLASQDTYSQLSSLLDQTASNWDAVGKAGLLLLTSMSGGLNTSFTEVQQVYSALLLLLVWLAVVWALRVILAGNKPKLRDALYNSGAPIVSTAIVLLIVVIQLLPLALSVVIVTVASSTGMFDSPTMSIIISMVAAGLGVLSIYWVTSSLIALVIVTLPGMYPWRAIQTAGDLVIGRRIRILLRLCWMLVCALVGSIVILLPIILIDRALKHALPAIEWLPIVPAVMALVSAAILIWSAAYVYLLYRKIVDDDASPA
mgnify:FL=1